MPLLPLFTYAPVLYSQYFVVDFANDREVPFDELPFQREIQPKSCHIHTSVGCYDLEWIASGLNDQRPKLEKLLADRSIGTIVVENRDRLTRFGSHYIETLLEAQGRHLELIFSGDTSDELVDDFIAVITSMAARIYGRRQSKRRAERIKQCVEAAMKEGE